MDCYFRDLPLNFHWWVAPPKTEQSIFLGLCSDEQLFFYLADRASFPHYNDTMQDHQIWLKTFYFMSNFLSTVIFGICH